MEDRKDVLLKGADEKRKEAERNSTSIVGEIISRKTVLGHQAEQVKKEFESDAD